MKADTPKNARMARRAKPLKAVGRPKTGKRSNPDYQQVSSWVRKDTYKKVTERLFMKEERREFSDLVQTLLEQWLRTP